MRLNSRIPSFTPNFPELKQTAESILLLFDAGTHNEHLPSW